jgi:hypothetical protein
MSATAASASATSTESVAAAKAAKRRATLQAKRQAEAMASAQLGKDVKISFQKPKIGKKKKATTIKVGAKSDKKWMLNYSLKVNKKTGEAKLSLKQHKGKDKTGGDATKKQ